MTQLASGIHAHKLIADTAAEMAHECYDALMHRDDWYALWRSQNPGANAKVLEARWVRQHTKDFLAGARHILTGMLSKPIDDDLKEAIYKALVLDASLMRGRA